MSSGGSSDSFLLQRDAFVTRRRPYFEGCNVGTWIGFKHIVYLAQEAVLDYLRDRGCAPGDLLQKHALVTEFVSCRLRLLKGTRVDDVVAIRVSSTTQPTATNASFDITFYAGHEDSGDRLVHGSVRVAWRPTNRELGDAAPPPAALGSFIASSADGRASPPAGLHPDSDQPWKALEALRPTAKASAVQCVRISYPMCQPSGQMGFWSHVKLLEEMVDRLLAERGISIATLLEERCWIPVVAKVEFEIERPAYMEEFLYCIFVVEELIKNIVFTGRMESYVVRNGKLSRVATSKIDHAYVQFTTREVGSDVVPFDAKVESALRGESSPR